MKETKEKIVLKALQYLAKNDYQTVSLNSIAEGIGITKGGIYHYFSSKDELFMECIFTAFRKMQEFTAEAMKEEASLEEVLTSFFSFDNIFKIMAESLQIDFVDNYFDFSYLMFVGIRKFPQVKQMLTDMYSQMQTELEMMFTDLQKKGVIKKEINCRLITFELMALLEGSMLIYGFTREINLLEVARDIVKSTLERISV